MPVITLHNVILALLLVAPITTLGYLQYKMNRYCHLPRRATNVYGFRSFQEADYAPEGRPWLRRFKLASILLVPYWVVVLLLVRAL